MNRLLVHYCVDVQHPEVSGAEHLEMLQIRDRLAELEPTLTAEEQEALVGADRVLVERAVAFHQELLRFLDLAEYRREHGIPPARWWWYLDVMSHLPSLKDETPEEKNPSPGHL
jgi:hypothetical protein